MSQKYLGSFLVTAILFIISGIIIFTQLNVAERDINQFEDEVIRSHDFAMLESLLQEKDLRIADYIITGDEKYVEGYHELVDEFNTLITELERNLASDEQRRLFGLILKNDAKITEVFNQIMETNNLDSLLTTTRRGKANGITGHNCSPHQ